MAFVWQQLPFSLRRSKLSRLAAEDVNAYAQLANMEAWEVEERFGPLLRVEPAAILGGCRELDFQRMGRLGRGAFLAFLRGVVPSGTGAEPMGPSAPAEIFEAFDVRRCNAVDYEMVARVVQHWRGTTVKGRPRFPAEPLGAPAAAPPASTASGMTCSDRAALKVLLRRSSSALRFALRAMLERRKPLLAALRRADASGRGSVPLVTLRLALRAVGVLLPDEPFDELAGLCDGLDLVRGGGALSLSAKVRYDLLIPAVEDLLYSGETPRRARPACERLLRTMRPKIALIVAAAPEGPLSPAALRTACAACGILLGDSDAKELWQALSAAHGAVTRESIALFVDPQGAAEGAAQSSSPRPAPPATELQRILQAEALPPSDLSGVGGRGGGVAKDAPLDRRSVFGWDGRAYDNAAGRTGAPGPGAATRAPLSGRDSQENIAAEHQLQRSPYERNRERHMRWQAHEDAQERAAANAPRGKRTFAPRGAAAKRLIDGARRGAEDAHARRRVSGADALLVRLRRALPGFAEAAAAAQDPAEASEEVLLALCLSLPPHRRGTAALLDLSRSDLRTLCASVGVRVGGSEMEDLLYRLEAASGSPRLSLSTFLRLLEGDSIAQAAQCAADERRALEEAALLEERASQRVRSVPWGPAQAGGAARPQRSPEDVPRPQETPLPPAPMEAERPSASQPPPLPPSAVAAHDRLGVDARRACHLVKVRANAICAACMVCDALGEGTVLAADFLAALEDAGLDLGPAEQKLALLAARGGVPLPDAVSSADDAPGMAAACERSGLTVRYVSLVKRVNEFLAGPPSAQARKASLPQEAPRWKAEPGQGEGPAAKPLEPEPLLDSGLAEALGLEDRAAPLPPEPSAEAAEEDAASDAALVAGEVAQSPPRRQRLSGAAPAPRDAAQGSHSAHAPAAAATPSATLADSTLSVFGDWDEAERQNALRKLRSPTSRSGDAPYGGWGSAEQMNRRRSDAAAARALEVAGGDALLDAAAAAVESRVELLKAVRRCGGEGGTVDASDVVDLLTSAQVDRRGLIGPGAAGELAQILVGGDGKIDFATLWTRMNRLLLGSKDDADQNVEVPPAGDAPTDWRLPWLPLRLETAGLGGLLRADESLERVVRHLARKRDAGAAGAPEAVRADAVPGLLANLGIRMTRTEGKRLAQALWAFHADLGDDPFAGVGVLAGTDRWVDLNVLFSFLSANAAL